MMVRDGVMIGVELITRHYPNFAPKDDGQLRALVSDYERALCFTDGETVAAGFRVALDRAGKFKPSFGEIRDAVNDAHRRRNVHAQLTPLTNDLAYCVACGTEAIQEVPHPTDATMPPRLWPIHRDGCRVRAA